MFRWQDVEDQTLFDMTVKMYREPFSALKTLYAPELNRELDHYAYTRLGSELYMYKILDTNFEMYIEERGDLNRMGRIKIPRLQSTGVPIY